MSAAGDVGGAAAADVGARPDEYRGDAAGKLLRLEQALQTQPLGRAHADCHLSRRRADTARESSIGVSLAPARSRGCSRGALARAGSSFREILVGRETRASRERGHVSNGDFEQRQHPWLSAHPVPNQLPPASGTTTLHVWMTVMCRGSSPLAPYPHLSIAKHQCQQPVEESIPGLASPRSTRHENVEARRPVIL